MVGNLTLAVVRELLLYLDWLSLQGTLLVDPLTIHPLLFVPNPWLTQKFTYNNVQRFGVLTFRLKTIKKILRILFI